MSLLAASDCYATRVKMVKKLVVPRHPDEEMSGSDDGRWVISEKLGQEIYLLRLEARQALYS